MSEATATKGVLATILVVIGYLYNSVGVLLIILMFAMAVDYVSGIISAFMRGELSSRIGLRGIIKKLCYMFLVLVAFLFDLAIIYTIENVGMQLPIQSIFGVLVTAWLFGNEAVSIIENLVEVGVPVPMFMRSGLKVFRDVLEKVNDKGADKNESN